MMQTSRCLKHILLFIETTNFISVKVNNFLSFLDPRFHKGLDNLKKTTRKLFPDVKVFADIDELLMEGRSLIYNRKTSFHVDSRDLLNGWQILIAGGHFTQGGSVLIPALGLRMRLLPGDMVALRGRVLGHEIEKWYGGQRICMVNFTHHSIWKYVEKLLVPGGNCSPDTVGDILMEMDSVDEA